MTGRIKSMTCPVCGVAKDFELVAKIYATASDSRPHVYLYRCPTCKVVRSEN